VSPGYRYYSRKCKSPLPRCARTGEQMRGQCLWENWHLEFRVSALIFFQKLSRQYIPVTITTLSLTRLSASISSNSTCRQTSEYPYFPVESPATCLILGIFSNFPSSSTPTWSSLLSARDCTLDGVDGILESV